jgi:drug/metabolite transporter (DMT)-like permease
MLLVVGISILGFSDNLVLVVSDSASVGQFHFIRSVFIIVGILLVARLMGLSVVPKRWPSMLIRTFCMVSAILLYFTAMPLMPIAEAGAGLFTSPIFVLMFSGIFLKEAIGLKQITMVVIGMVGMVLILAPNIGGLTLFHLFPLGAGAMYAIASMLTFRYLSGESPLSILLCFMLGIGICGGLITTVFSIFPVSQVWMDEARFLFSPWTEVSKDYLLWVGIIAMLSLLALVCITRAYQMTKTSQVAIYEYAYLVSVGISSYFIWDVVPPPHGLIGIGLIVATGLTISLYGERTRLKNVSERSVV